MRLPIQLPSVTAFNMHTLLSPAVCSGRLNHPELNLLPIYEKLYAAYMRQFLGDFLGPVTLTFDFLS